MSRLQQHVDFDLIRYANCWEDTDVLLRGLNLKRGADILCIASAGDNALSLLATQPNSVRAIDLSDVQLYLNELKQMAFSCLQHDELLQLLGIKDSAIRTKLYNKVRTLLKEPARTYWDANKPVIEHGIIYAGKFEQYFKKFRSYTLPLAHRKETTWQLLEKKSQAEQERFYYKQWNTWRFRLLMNIFFSKYVMGKYGRDPQFLKHVQIPVAQYIRQKTEQHLQSALCQDNYFLHMIFTGSFGNTLPHYLREENFEIIRTNIHKLTLEKISAEDAIKKHAYDAYCLSNIFEYISETEFAQIANSWPSYMKPGTKLAYWNLMTARSLSETNKQAYIYNNISEELTRIDKGFFYSRFVTEEKR